MPMHGRELLIRTPSSVLQKRSGTDSNPEREHIHIKLWKIAIEFFCTSHFLQRERKGSEFNEGGKKAQGRQTNEKQTF